MKRNLHPSRYTRLFKTIFVLFLSSLLFLLVSMNQWTYASKTTIQQAGCEQTTDGDASNPAGPDEKVPDNGNDNVSEEYVHESIDIAYLHYKNMRVIPPLGHEKLPVHFLTLFSPPPEMFF